MRCIYCEGKTKVVESFEYNGYVYRKRKCYGCDEHIYTKEEKCKDTEGARAISKRYEEQRKKKNDRKID